MHAVMTSPGRKYDRSLSGDLFGNWLHSDSSRPQLRSLRAGYAIKKRRKKKRRLPEGEIACRSFLCRAPAVLLPFAGTFSRDILCACALLFSPERDTLFAPAGDFWGGGM